MREEVKRIEDFSWEFVRLVADIQGMSNEVIKIIKAATKGSDHVVFSMSEVSQHKILVDKH